jgi:peptide/nickel transport system permease protein
MPGLIRAFHLQGKKSDMAERNPHLPETDSPLLLKSTGSFRQRALKRFRSNRMALWAFRLILALVVVALLADVLANEKPLLCKIQGRVYSPVLRSCGVELGLCSWPANLVNADWQNLPYTWAVFPPVPYLPQNLDHQNEHGVSPTAHQHVRSRHWRHWLGTDELGRDILAGMIHGTRVALMVGIVSMGIAFLIGLFFGAAAGYFGDSRLQISRARAWLNALFGFLAFFYAFLSRSFEWQDALADSVMHFVGEFLFSMSIGLLILVLGNALVPLFKRIPFFQKKLAVPVDLVVSRLIEVMLSIPTLFLLISVSAIVTKPSLTLVMVIIGLTGWTGIARFIRAELLRVRNLGYIEAAHAMGFSELRVLFRHALPNALSPALIALAFGIASAILTESLLSFLGIGVPAESITWGSMLSMARQSPGSWWLAVFPGFAIFITVTVYNLVGEGLTEAFDPKQKN